MATASNLFTANVLNHARKGGLMFYNPWFAAAMLAFEASNVIDRRLKKIARGGPAADAESRLMISEKIDAAFEAGAMIMAGRTTADVISRYRQHVAANAARLT